MEDPSLEGGGLHQSTRGGFLNIHADFTVHPHHRNWQRRANLILYLNEDWEASYGGDLELWSTDMKECVEKVSPVANRAVIFTTDATSFHGHPEPMQCPEGVARRSLALYYYSVQENPLVRSTEYRSRPGDGARSILIFADKHLLRTYDWMKRHLGLSDQFAASSSGFVTEFVGRAQATTPAADASEKDWTSHRSDISLPSEMTPLSFLAGTHEPLLVDVAVFRFALIAPMRTPAGRPVDRR